MHPRPATRLNCPARSATCKLESDRCGSSCAEPPTRAWHASPHNFHKKQIKPRQQLPTRRVRTVSASAWRSSARVPRWGADQNIGPKARPPHQRKASPSLQTVKSTARAAPVRRGQQMRYFLHSRDADAAERVGVRVRLARTRSGANKVDVCCTWYGPLYHLAAP